MIRVLFIHQNLPGQFRRVIRHLETKPDFSLVASGEKMAVKREPFGPNVRVIGYPKPDRPGEKTHPYLKYFEGCVRRGQTVACLLMDQSSNFLLKGQSCHSLFVK
jgi:hypothetical protein